MKYAIISANEKGRMNMNTKKLNINKRFASTILTTSITLSTIGGVAFYYSYNNNQQICEQNITTDDTFINDNGEICYRFETGEHIIRISRNDAYYHKIEGVEGYTISEVEINGWRYNSKVTYVNTEPVIVVATVSKNGKLEFNNFGKVVNKQNVKKN